MTSDPIGTRLGPSDPVRAVTAFEVASCHGDSTARDIAKLLRDERCGVLLVYGSGTVAVVSERDVVRALAEGDDPDAVWAVDVMSRSAIMIEPDATIEAAAELMLEAGVRHLVVDDQDGDRYGVVSMRDLVDPLLAGLDVIG